MNRYWLHIGCALVLGAGSVLASGCGGGGDAGVDATPEYDAPPPQGTLSLDWQIQYNDTTLTCAQVGAISVRLTITPSDGGTGVPEALNCDPNNATTTDIDVGVYDIAISLIAETGFQPLGEPYTLNDVEVMANQNTSLGTVVFNVVPRGNLAFKLDTDTGTTNCKTDAEGGAGITEVAIELRDSEGACVPTSFEIEAGASQPAGTYTSDCAGARYACIENDQQIRVTGTPSGATSMVMTGYKGQEACYARMPQFTVPGNDLTLTLNDQVLTRAMVPACDPQ